LHIDPDGGMAPMDEKLRERVAAYAIDAVAGHLIRRCQQRALDVFVAEVGEDGPTPTQFAVLLNVFQNPGMSQTALVQASGIDRSTLTEILRRMIGRGLISRTRLKEDQRANALTLTRAGEDMLAAAFEGADRTQDRILEPVPAELRATAIEILFLLAGYETGAPARDETRIKTDAPA
jgi:DNA-binding MarR family transcriptional regulator